MIPSSAFTRLILRYTLISVGTILLLVISLLLVTRTRPDSGYMVFWMDGSRGQALYVIDIDHPMRTRLYASPPYLVVEIPHLSRNGQRAVFETVDKSRLSIHVTDIRSGLLYSTPSSTEDRLAALSPDGRMVAYWSTTEIRFNTRFQNWHLMIRDIDQRTTRTITRQLAVIPYESPLWSPDGRRLAVRYWDAGRDAGIFIIDVENGDARHINELDASSDLAWSPNGEQLAFRSTRDGNPEIYVFDLPSQQMINVTNHPENDFQPAWSPDGTRITFASNRDDNGEVFLMNVDGSNLLRLTEGGGFRPIWSPGGNQIAFTSERALIPAIYVINTAGSDPRYVTGLDQGDRFVGWYESEN